ncbi:MAG: hypothetical protein JW901_12925 [Dehalococcoidia bacterium]|nr:hypothetical protein [Dehalococcoidia bacterium]
MKRTKPFSAYQYIYAILESHWYNIKDEQSEASDELAGVLSEMGAIEQEINGKLEVSTSDPAAWYDWLEEVEKITEQEKITVDEAKLAFINVMKLYKSQGLYLDQVIEFLEQYRLPDDR